MNFKTFLLSEKAITISFGGNINIESFEKVLALKKIVKTQNWEWFSESVSAYNSLTIYVLDSFYTAHNSLKTFFESWLSGKEFMVLENDNFNETEVKQVNVKYKGEDLSFISEFTKLSESQIIKIHTDRIYTVAMIGFLPGFPYLLGMDDRLFVPRKKEPRLKVKKGSVGIAGFQTGIYPNESPGGWQIIGHTDLELFNPDPNKLSYFKLGDRIKFIAI
ncbi:5-oxoprolinase subunit PxpB [Lacihabitans sp. LS3-19]|uniref:5-oxoprolinase subunit PxpB n=1 Tax=Lacihabitans sp. LS3-19 TaxID=2487335 RepID=UPI0020CF4606|nr:5-oxoprolinase subunit PxpB [Lacihabitans sp. LS3-19]MCP9768150.1 5-oxoprolinase subunit PxpB [Lacihabitans sp. LS3-19]